MYLLPRRYSSHPRSHNSPSSNSAHPTIGSSGSTPLHFAAANGHAHVVRLLLLHGAHADRRDKHGVTPEMLARECGNDEVADILKQWVLNKDKDLRERGDSGASVTGHGEAGETVLVGGGGGTGTRPINGGWGIGNGRDDDDEDVRQRTLSGGRLKVKASIDQALNTFKSAASMQSYLPSCPDPEAVTFPRTASSSSGRRPSFPEYNTSSSSSYGRRPSSAGQGSQSFDEPDRQRVPSSTQQRRLGSKYSLRNLFKKANDSNAASSAVSSAEPSYTTTPDISASPSPGPNSNLPLPNTSGPASPRGALINLAPLESSPLASKGHSARIPSDSDSIFSQGANHRTRSGSGSGLPTEDDAMGNGSGGSARPSILRSHHRTSSGNGSSSVLLSSRAIRFDESGGSSQTSLVGKARNTVSRALNGLERSLSPGRGGVKKSTSVGSFAEESGNAENAQDPEGEDEEYGEVIRSPETKTRLAPIKPEAHSNSHRGRGASFASSTCSLSPIFSPDSETQGSGKGFPFSIERPPPLDETLLTVPAYAKDKNIEGEENEETRQRGGSVSSTSTNNTDANPQLSWSSSTTGTGSSIATSGGSTLVGPSSPGISGRRAHVPVDIDIRSISSHAQAEALVQAAQQSILEMDISGSGKGSGLSGLPSPLFDGDELTGRSPLSARLAAYGETLALERRLKRAEEEKIAKEKEGEAEDAPTLILFARDKESQRSPRAIGGRKLAGTDTSPKPTNASRARIRQPRRPNTSESGTLGVSLKRCPLINILPVSSNHPTSVFNSERPRAYHQTSRSTSAVGGEPASLSTKDDIGILESASIAIPFSPSSPLNVPIITTSAEPDLPAHSHLTYPHYPPLTRSITPDPPSPNESALHNIPLSRCSTAPEEDHFIDDLKARATGRSLQADPIARHIATASKLTRMGFSAQAQPGATQESPKSSRFGIKSFFKSSK
ncbi:hypothetical protein HWV62_30709 [Athelia sp. TMB]|nr:hypothetical protein HWV62_30709 [Athelia sp. TMB]